DRDCRNFALAFLGRPCPAWRGLEFRLHRRDHHGDPLPSAERAQQSAGVQRFSRLRLDGDRLILLRGAVGELRLEHGERGRVPGGAGGKCAARLGRAARAQAGRLMPARDGIIRPEIPGAAPCPLENTTAAEVRYVECPLRRTAVNQTNHWAYEPPYC